jgi:hypothetical protein
MPRYNDPITTKDLNPIVEQRTIISKDGVRFYYDLLSRVGYLSSQGLTAARNWILPNRSGTIELQTTSIRTATSATSLDLTDKTLLLTSGTFNVDILTAIGNSGITFEVTNKGSGIITLDPSGSELIEGISTLIIPAQTGVTIKSDGVGWIVINKSKQELINSTQWVKSIATTTITNGNSLNLLTLLVDADKSVNGTDGGIYELSIATNKILTYWKGNKSTHHLRVLFTITTGTDQHYTLTLRRFSDNSILSAAQLNRNSDTGLITADFITYTYSAIDPFVTGGFYIQLDNNSGASVDLTTSLNLLIETHFK